MVECDEPLFSLAVIADAHFHDVEGDYGVPGIAAHERSLTLQTWAHSRESTRVYNESTGALDAALDAVAARRIRHVVLLGDYTDDGQRETTASLARRLAEHEARFGTRFYALPGNHDIFGPFGRHQSRYFQREEGAPVLVTSDGRAPKPGSVVTPAMFCEGYPAGLLPMARHGYFRRSDDLLWETPFGDDDDPDARTYDIVSKDGKNRYRLMDASYLVEPEKGLWLLMIDANVFEPRNGDVRPRSKQAFIDSTAAGWNALLQLKPFLIDWIGDVSRRARAAGKTLLAFSHYPTVDPFDDRQGYEQALFPDGTIAKRKPHDGVAEALIAAGISLHFSGHWHVDGVSRRSHAGRTLTNIAVPSLVAFPPAFKQLSVGRDAVTVETLDLSSLPLDADIMALYHEEAERNGLSVDAALSATNYGEFLRCHTRALVAYRFFPKEWPKAVVSVIASMTLAELFRDPRTRPEYSEDGPTVETVLGSDAAAMAVIDLIADWYCLRQAGSMAIAAFGNQSLEVSRRIAGLYVDLSLEVDEREVAAYLATFFRSFLFYLSRAERTADTVRFAL